MVAFRLLQFVEASTTASTTSTAVSQTTDYRTVALHIALVPNRLSRRQLETSVTEEASSFRTEIPTTSEPRQVIPTCTSTCTMIRRRIRTLTDSEAGSREHTQFLPDKPPLGVLFGLAPLSTYHLRWPYDKNLRATSLDSLNPLNPKP